MTSELLCALRGVAISCHVIASLQNCGLVPVLEKTLVKMFTLNESVNFTRVDLLDNVLVVHAFTLVKT